MVRHFFARLRVSLSRRLVKPRLKQIRMSSATEVSAFAILCCIMFFIAATYYAASTRTYRLRHDIERIQDEHPIHEKNHLSSSLGTVYEKRAIVMSCPFGPSHNHHGSWKPSVMIHGVEAVVHQLQRFKSTLPVLFGYYNADANRAEPWCKEINAKAPGTVRVTCFKIPERYPVGLYGYAKIFAIAHAPVLDVLWLDCDMYPVRPLEPLFDDVEFRKTGAMFWPDSRDHFDESKLESVFSTEEEMNLFPLDSWWVRQGFDSGILLLQKRQSSLEIETLCDIARDRSFKELRSLSMGDKDLFHIVWMLHRKNFTLVPWIGESGNLEVESAGFNLRSRRRRRRHRARVKDQTPKWIMSSQLKLGRDEEIYALHQLHHYPRGGRVKPRSMVKIDLRVVDSDNVQMAVQNRLVVPSVGPKWIEDMANDMSRSWGNDKSHIQEVAKTLYEAHVKRIKEEREARIRLHKHRNKYNKRIYHRLWGRPVHRTVVFKSNESSSAVTPRSI